MLVQGLGHECLSVNARTEVQELMYPPPVYLRGVGPFRPFKSMPTKSSYICVCKMKLWRCQPISKITRCAFLQDTERERAAEAGGAWDAEFVQAYEVERRRQERVYEARQRGATGAAPSEDPFAVRTVFHLMVQGYVDDNS